MVETRRSSSSSKRPLSSASSPLPNGKRSKPIETLDSLKQSGIDSRDHADRSSDPVFVKPTEGTVAEKSPDGQVESEPLVSPMSLGDSAIDVEKTRLNCAVLNRGKKRQMKSNVGVAWGKLLSQCSQVGFSVSTHCITMLLRRWVGGNGESWKVCRAFIASPDNWYSCIPIG
ncbi:unnamed protein product [Ilex paraguariensis]|uniref:Uncharacterized protein n=1 Tax=Ilex paraguariensis TaxID=185542 RepID=A0ABC8U5E7_9AQUA